jgi:hypothetical protein
MGFLLTLIWWLAVLAGFALWGGVMIMVFAVIPFSFALAARDMWRKARGQ